MIIYGLPNCDKCRAARKARPDADFQDIRETPLSPDFLAGAYDVLGAALLNTRSTTWRGLSEAERAKTPLDLLQAHPTLMKRPLIAAGDQLYLGWTKDVQVALTAK